MEHHLVCKRMGQSVSCAICGPVVNFVKKSKELQKIRHQEAAGLKKQHTAVLRTFLERQQLEVREVTCWITKQRNPMPGVPPADDLRCPSYPIPFKTDSPELWDHNLQGLISNMQRRLDAVTRRQAQEISALAKLRHEQRLIRGYGAQLSVETMEMFPPMGFGVEAGANGNAAGYTNGNAPPAFVNAANPMSKGQDAAQTLPYQQRQSPNVMQCRT
jgi:hypothetical protein